MALRQEVLTRSQALRDVREAADSPATGSSTGPAQVGNFANALDGALRDIFETRRDASGKPETDKEEET